MCLNIEPAKVIQMYLQSIPNLALTQPQPIPKLAQMLSDFFCRCSKKHSILSTPFSGAISQSIASVKSLYRYEMSPHCYAFSSGHCGTCHKHDRWRWTGDNDINCGHSPTATVPEDIWAIRIGHWSACFSQSLANTGLWRKSPLSERRWFKNNRESGCTGKYRIPIECSQ